MLSHGSGSQVALPDMGKVGGNWTRSCHQGLSTPQSPVQHVGWHPAALCWGKGLHGSGSVRKWWVKKNKKGNDNSWAIPQQLDLVWKPAWLRLGTPALRKLAGLCSPCPPAVLVTGSGLCTPSPIEGKGAMETPWRAPGRGSLPGTAFCKCSLAT